MTGFRNGYVRGIASQLREGDGVDAGAVSDCVVNNLVHLYEATRPHIVNFVSDAALTSALRQDEPNASYFVLLGRWPFPLHIEEDGGSANVVYRFKGYRSGGSGDVTFGVRLGTQTTLRPFTTGASVTQAEHTTGATTPTAFSGTLYIPPAVVATWHRPILFGDGSAAIGVRLAWFEVWVLMLGAKPSIRISSMHARQFRRT